MATPNSAAAANKNPAPPPQLQPPLAAVTPRSITNANGDLNQKLTATPPPSRPLEPPSSTQSDVVLIPSYSRWFSWKNIHECEVRNLPEFFEGRSASKNPRVYKYYRNSIIQRFRENPTRKITFTDVRKTIIGDVGSVRRVFDFVETWGLINYFGAPSSRPQKLEDKDTSKSLNNNAAGGAVTTAAANDSGAAGSDFTGSRKRLCSICKSVCSIACFACDKDDVTLCARCFVRGSYKVGVSSSDFRRVEISDEEKTDWTHKDTLHLLEAVMHYRDDWKRVSEYVGNGRSARECVSHFVKLPFGEQFTGPVDSTEVNGNIHQLIDQRGVESGSQTTTVSPAKRTRLSPLADASNPIMAQAAFLSALVGVNVAEAAAQAAVWALYDGYSGTNAKESIESLSRDGVREQETCVPSNCDTTTKVSVDAFEEARVRLKKDEADLEKTISGTLMQMKEFQKKIIQFEEFDLQKEKESQQLEQLKNLLFADELAVQFHKAAASKSQAEDVKALQIS